MGLGDQGWVPEYTEEWQGEKIKWKDPAHFVIQKPR